MKKLLGCLAIALLFSITVEAQGVRIPSGYHGFMDYCTSYCPVGGVTAIELSTTHGCYFTDNAYLGMGLGIEGSSGNWFLVPVFVTLKYNFTYDNPFTPTAQIRMGSYLGDEIGVCGDVAFGLRFGTRRNFAFNLMLICSLFQPIDYGYYLCHEGGYYGRNLKKYPSGFGIRFGIEW